MFKQLIFLTSFVLMLGLTTGVLNAAEPFLQADDADGIVSMEAERFHYNVAQGDHTWEMVTATEGFTGLVGMQSLPNQGTNIDTGYVDSSPRLDFQITFVKTGTHYVWIRAWSAGGSDDSCHAGLDGQATDSADRIDGYSGEYTWTNHTRDPDPATIDITDVGVHTLNLYIREDGSIIDKIVLTTNPDYVPEGDGPAESPGGGSGPVKAFAPIPADGAIEVDTLTLEWIAAYTAASNKVYLSTDETIDESDLVGETAVALIAPAMEAGTTYYWRVDAVEADGTVTEGDLWSFSTLAPEAHFPSPEDGATEVAIDAQLSWTAGKGAVLHNVYFGTDEAAVAASDMSTSMGMMMETTLDPGPLEPFMTYYWKVDEFAGFTTNPGPVWSFDTTKYILISDDEVTLDYDNSVEPFLSEVALDTPADLTYGGVSELTLRFHGGPGPEGSASLDEATGTYTITGSGADIWGTSDQFHYAYRELTGDATITARVVDNGTGSNSWAKGGVMIRQSLDPNSINVFGAITGGDGDGGTFQWRPVQGESSSSNRTLTGIAPPYYVRLVREGNTFTVSMSADGVDWAQQGTDPATIEMTDPVLIGLAVTSHQAGEKRTFVFDNVDIVGNISADDASTDIGIPFNTPEPIYVVLEDDTGAVAVVTHANPEATMIDMWRDWTIPLSKFSGVDPSTAVKLYIGVGDGEPGGSGTIRTDDIRVVMSATAANIIWVSFHEADDVPSAGASGAGFTEAPDKGYTDLLTANGYNVMRYITTSAPDPAVLNAVDLVIISRSVASGGYQNDGATAWNSISTPMIIMQGWALRSSRMGYTTGTTMEDITGDVTLTVNDPTHPIFAGIPLTDGTMDNPFAGVVVYPTDGTTVARGTSINTDPVNADGTVLATISAAGNGPVGGMVIGEWPAGTLLTHAGGAETDTLAGHRLVFLSGAREADGISSETAGIYDLLPDGEQIFLNAVNMMLPVKVLDVTAPGDIVQGIPTGLPCGVDPSANYTPCGELPPLVIDNDSGTKYLNFAGNFDADEAPSGFQVTPLDGPSIVTGLTLTTANDEAPRDPIAFELYGSNESIDGPYELIASGDIVDFAQETEWPRFTKNETPISFDNDVAYSHYQILFTALRDAASANSMQIAEVELIGVPEPTPADVTAPGDLVQGIPTGLPCGGDPSANYTPCGELPPLVIDNTKRTKYLNFGGNFDPGEEPSGFQVTPSAGPTIVTGMTFTTANDSPARDPAAFELYGSNESIDGPYELIAVGDIVDFAQETEWPRFRMNATPISFDNTVAYAHYQVLFTALRDAAADNSMQIAEVELIGVPAQGEVEVPEFVFAEDFESYAAGSDLHGQGGWKGWDNTAGAGAPASDAFAVSGLNSVEVIGSADLVHEFDLAGGMLELSAMQYIPSGTTGTTYFILLNTYNDGGPNDWSGQTSFDLAAGTIAFWHGGEATILYDQWVELKYIIDLDNNTVDKYYNGELIATDQWDDNVNGTLGAIDLFGNGASSVYYDDITVTRL